MDRTKVSNAHTQKLAGNHHFQETFTVFSGDFISLGARTRYSENASSNFVHFSNGSILPVKGEVIRLDARDPVYVLFSTIPNILIQHPSNNFSR